MNVFSMRVTLLEFAHKSVFCQVFQSKNPRLKHYLVGLYWEVQTLLFRHFDGVEFFMEMFK